MSRRSSKSDAQFTLEVKDGQKEANASTKEDEINIIDLKELFEKEIELWKSEKEESKKYKEKVIFGFNFFIFHFQKIFTNISLKSGRKL